MNRKTHLQESAKAPVVEPALQPADREQLQSDIVAVLWAQAHILARIVGREHHLTSPGAGQGITVFDAVADRLVGSPAVRDLEASAIDCSVGWADVAHTAFAETMESLYDFAYFATFNPDHYPHELMWESHSWWVGMYLRELASSSSLQWQAEYSGHSEVKAAKRLLETVEIANARNLLEGATDTFLDESEPGFLTIRELALVSGFKEESLRALANPKRKNPLPTQSHKGTTVVAAEDARVWLKAKGRYQPVTARRNARGLLKLDTAKFESPDELCFALSEHIRALGNHEQDAQATLEALKVRFPRARWLNQVENDPMGLVNLCLTPDDLKDDDQVRALATILDFNPDLLVLKAEEAQLRARLAAVESRIKTTSAHKRTLN